MRTLTILAVSLSAVCAARVDSIRVTVHEPYPEAKGIAGFVYSVLNLVHVNSKAGTVLRLCPLSVGDTVNQSLLRETERILRSYPFWCDAEAQMESTTLAIDVQDAWTTKLEASLRYIAAETEWSVALEEENLLGLGAYLSAGFAHYIEGNWAELSGKLYGFPTKDLSPSLSFRKRNGEWKWALSLKSTSDSELAHLIIFSDVAAGSTSVPRFASGATPVDSLNARRWRGSAEALVRFGDVLGGVGAHYRLASLHATTLPDTGYAVVAAACRLCLLGRAFRQMRNVDNLARAEDIPTGVLIDVAAGAAVETNANEVSPLFALRLGAATDLGCVYGAASLDARIEPFEQSLALSARAFAPTKPQSPWRIGVAADLWRISSAFGEKFIVADDRTGFRGLPAYFAVCDWNETQTLLKLSAEARLFPNVEVFTFRLGLAAFADAGYLPSQDEALVDFGVGVRICSTRAARGSITRAEVSYSPQTGKVGFTLSTGQAFSFYLPLGISPLFTD